MASQKAPHPPSSPAYEAYTELIAQELRTPIATIALYLDLMSRDRVLDDPAIRRDYLEVARGQAHQLSALVQELTQFTDLASGRMPSGVEALTAVESLPTLVQSIAGRNPLVLDISDEAITATVDTDRLRVVLQQLLDNAFKFNPSGGKVIVRGRVLPNPPSLVVQIINEGQVLPELHERIFNAFQQGRLDPDPSTREHGGLGLGLTVARGAAEGAGGSLVLEPGDVTSFRLEMPIREDPLARETRSLREQVEMLDKQAEAVVLDLREALAEGRKKDQALEEAEKQQIEVLRDLQGLHRETRMLSQQLSQSYLDTVAALARAVQARDGQAADHIEGVRRSCIAIANQLGIHDQDERTQLEFAAVLHDVGKVALPDHLLTSSDALTPEEWEQMRAHPEAGARLIEGIEFLEQAREAVIAHHENWDGTGYPRGLAGREIPRSARIIAVADAYETMINGRPYRAKLSFEAACQELRDQRGRQFDPVIVDALLATFETGRPAPRPLP